MKTRWSIPVRPKKAQEPAVAAPAETAPAETAPVAKAVKPARKNSKEK